jgi:hypothetical protein
MGIFRVVQYFRMITECEIKRIGKIAAIFTIIRLSLPGKATELSARLASIK